MDDIGVTVEAGPSDWILAEAALSSYLSHLYREQTEMGADSAPPFSSFELECVRDAIRCLERVRHAILEAVYPDTSEEDDPYQTADDLALVEDHGYPLISVSR